MHRFLGAVVPATSAPLCGFILVMLGHFWHGRREWLPFLLSWFWEMPFSLVFGNAVVIQFEVESPKNVKTLWWRKLSSLTPPTNLKQVSPLVGALVTLLPVSWSALSSWAWYYLIGCPAHSCIPILTCPSWEVDWKLTWKKMGYAHGEIMYFMGEAKEISSGKTWGLGIINSQVSLNPTRQLKPSVSLER